MASSFFRVPRPHERSVPSWNLDSRYYLKVETSSTILEALDYDSRNNKDKPPTPCAIKSEVRPSTSWRFSFLQNSDSQKGRELSQTIGRRPTDLLRHHLSKRWIVWECQAKQTCFSELPWSCVAVLI